MDKNTDITRHLGYICVKRFKWSVDQNTTYFLYKGLGRWIVYCTVISCTSKDKRMFMAEGDPSCESSLYLTEMSYYYKHCKGVSVFSYMKMKLWEGGDERCCLSWFCITPLMVYRALCIFHHFITATCGHSVCCGHKWKEEWRTDPIIYIIILRQNLRKNYPCLEFSSVSN